MRISDWSSDVCSSDPSDGQFDLCAVAPIFISAALCSSKKSISCLRVRRRPSTLPNLISLRSLRSEEHTSELQSLMRISYAVFCLKKKIKSTISNVLITYIVINIIAYHMIHHFYTVDTALHHHLH